MDSLRRMMDPDGGPPDPGVGRPSVTAPASAEGYGEQAEQLIAAAGRLGLPVHPSPEVVALLMQLDVDARIPPRLYSAIAGLLVWLDGLSRADPDAAG